MTQGYRIWTYMICINRSGTNMYTYVSLVVYKTKGTIRELQSSSLDFPYILSKIDS